MALTADSLDGFLPLLATSDTKSKLTIANNLINYLAEPESSIECSDIGQFIDSLIPWMQSSNNKVSQAGIDAMAYVVDRMGADFRPYVATVLPPIIDRLGDSKEVVREKAQLLLLRLAEREVLTPQALLERLTPAFAHKNGKIREEVLQCLQRTLTEHGAAQLSVSRLVPHVVKLLSDPMATVRDTALATLVEVYRHVGERLRHDLQKKHSLPASKVPVLMARFDELRAAGDLLPSALAADGPRAIGESSSVDEVDRAAPRRASSVPRRSAPAVTAAPAASRSFAAAPSSGGSVAGQAGAVDEETFRRAFADVVPATIFSARELDEQLAAARDALGDSSKDWNKRVEAMRRLRTLVAAAAAAGGALEEALLGSLRPLESPLAAAARDLRSQVVREACISVAYVSEVLRVRADRFAEALLPTLLSLIQNSAKVMATAGAVAARFLLRNTPAPRLIPSLCRELASSKSRDIRRACADLLALALSSWPPHALERHAALLQDGVRRGVADADPEARLSARKAYWAFRSHFPEMADQLLQSLDASYRRALNGEALSASSSSNSLQTQAHGTGGRYGGAARLRSTGSAQDGPGSGRRAAGAGVGVRSSSAIDLQAAQRAKARAQYAALARHKVGSGASLPRPRKSSDAGLGSAAASAAAAAAAAAAASPERVGRTRCRVAGVSQSQPSSRSGSPSSRLSYATYSARLEAARGGGDVTDSGGRPRRLTGIPRSTGASREASRETSPSRFASGTFSGSFAQPFGSKLRGRSLAGLERPTARPVMAQKILQQSREAESAIADALNCDSPESGDFSRTVHGRKRLFDDHSDDSETSSVCSERSFDSFRRPSDSFSWSGSQQRLYRESLETSFPDISEIIANCASTHWSDRKEGLVGLQVFLQNGQLLRPSELQRVTEIFTKMFMDSHTKVFSLFLDTLLELLQAHRADLHDWLYVLLTRLLNKLGTDLLNSIHAKIQRVLAQVREAFPAELQLACVMRFLTDATQTPNARVRAATLAHLSALCAACGDPSAVPTRSPAPQALARIVALADGRHSKQPAEVRRAAHGALVALFDLAAPQVAMMLAELPREYQEIAAPMLQSHLRRSSGAGGTGVSGGTGGSPPSPGRASPAGALGSPGTPLAPRPTRADDDELNPEEVYRSLRRTTAEIQSYPFGDAGSGGGGGVVGGTATSVGSTKLPDRDRDTTSQDSGISQMSTGAGDKMDALEEHFEALSLTRNNSGRSSSLSSPTHRHNSLQDYNGIDADSLGHTENGFLTRESQEDSEALRKALEVVRPQDNLGASEVTLSNSSERRQAFIALQRLAKEANSSVINEHFRVLLRVLLELLGRPDEPRRDYVLGVLSELLLRRDVSVGFHNYVELLVLKVLEAYKDGNKDVMRMGEVCSASVGATLPPDTVIKVLNPLITTGDFPVNLGAIKMLMKVVESRPKEQLEPHLGDVMPALIKAYNNEESPVRKSAVFCMVALHNVLGEEALQPHLAKLSGSKLKLLHLYIRRAQAGTGGGGGGGGGGSGSSGNASAPTSPKNNQAP